jgi:hypothetical protein
MKYELILSGSYTNAHLANWVKVKYGEGRVEYSCRFRTPAHSLRLEQSARPVADAGGYRLNPVQRDLSAFHCEGFSI